MSYARRVDRNQAEVVAKLRACGVTVLCLHAVGKGVPDLIAYYRPRGIMAWLEVKDGAKTASRRKLTPAELEFGKHWPVHVVTSAAEALRVFGIEVGA